MYEKLFDCSQWWLVDAVVNCTVQCVYVQQDVPKTVSSITANINVYVVGPQCNSSNMKCLSWLRTRKYGVCECTNACTSIVHLNVL